jgi:hypothetical protein
MTLITIFRDIKDTETPYYVPIDEALRRIKEGKNKSGDKTATQDLVKAIRDKKDKSKRDEAKRNLPAICFSGTFKKRADSSIQEHSGFICLDFDNYKTTKEVLEAKKILTKDKYVYSVFISPSGKGLKVIVKIPKDVERHTQFFLSLEKHFDSPQFDKTSKNISRACFESYDPLLYINENSLVWEKIEEIEQPQLVRYKDKPTLPITDENKIVDILLKWWEKKYPMVEGQRNNNAFVLARAFNDFGINKSLAFYVLNRYQTKNFPAQEIQTTIDSAYSNTDSFNTRFYEDEDRVNQMKTRLKRGASKKELRSQLQDLPIESDVIDSFLNDAEEEQASQTFWTKTERGVVRIEHVLFKHFLEDNGYYKFCPEGAKNYIFVKVTNNLIDHTSEKEIKDFILDYLLEMDDIAVYNYFAENTKYFREEFLTLLSSIEVYFIEDTKDAAYLYYLNCAVCITKNKIKPIDYVDLGGYVWKDHVIQRNFQICEVGECDYEKFIENICSKSKGRKKSMESTIGFMLHAHKNLSHCPAVILNDEVISDNPEGGTGKGIFMNALGHMKKMVVIDGKSFAFERSFAYQLVSADTQVLCFDDVKKHFDFERLFSVVTEGLTLEKKNKDAIKIPFSKSPKIAITTNYAIKGSGNSFERRKWELELHQHYNKNFTPLDEFGKLMFGDWSEDEWCQFDNYMVGCLQYFLEHGLVKSQFVNLDIRKLSAETCHEFIEWCGLIGREENTDLELDKKIYKDDLYREFIQDNPDYAPRARMSVSRTHFYRWLDSYSKYKYGVLPDQGRDSKGRWVRFRNRHELEQNATLDL